jgi:tetratricopeptide (TPR) repeat protein
MATRSILWLLIPALVALLLLSHPAAAQQPAQSSAPSSAQQSSATSLLDESQRAQLLKQRDAIRDTAQEQYNAGNFDKALDAVRKMLALDQQMQGPDNDDAADAISSIGVIYEAKEDWEAARQARQDALEMLTRLHGPNSWLVTNARLQLDDLPNMP